MRNKALLIIDVQNAMFQDGKEVFQGEQLLNRIRSLLVKSRNAGIPVFYVQHNKKAGGPLENGTYGWEIHPRIAPQENDIIIQKKTPDSFFETTLEKELKERNIDSVFLAGIQTELCVDTTARSAFSHDYKVTVVSDAHSTWDTAELSAQQVINHHNGLLHWFADVYPSSQINFNEQE